MRSSSAALLPVDTVSKDFFLKTNERKRKKERTFEEIKIIIFVNHFLKKNIKK